jgi:hypothetical protein
MTSFEKIQNSLPWLPAYCWQRLFRRPSRGRPIHLIICVADHFEPSIVPNGEMVYAHRDEQERRLERWCRGYPKAVQDFPDSDGKLFCHTYFFPAEQYQESQIDRLADFCKQGWGEIEIHLHHGVEGPDTSENARRQLVEFRDRLVSRGCLSQMDGGDQPRYAFVHGNFALANSARNRYCGVDDEMQVLSDTGCYADFTLPSAPSVSQIARINALYECKQPLNQRAAHRYGEDLVVRRRPGVLPLIVQGPLMLNFSRRRKSWPFPGIENGELTGAQPPTLERLKLWIQAAITVKGRSDWLFIKLHCHGMDPRDDEVMLGAPLRQYLTDLTELAGTGGPYRVHFVTAREMVNIILAACDGREGNPGDYRDHRLIPFRGKRGFKARSDRVVLRVGE